MDAAAGTFLSAVFANRRRESRGNSNVRSSLPHQCPNGGIGRRAAFRSQFSQGSGGSSPLSGTNPQTSSLACGCGRVCKYSPQPRKSGLSPAISSSVFKGVVRLVRCRTWSMKRRMDFQRLDGWIRRRIWSHRYRRWRNAGWKRLPARYIGVDAGRHSGSFRRRPRRILGSEEARLRAGLRPPPKLPVHTSCRQLSRRLSDARMREKELNRAGEQARTGRKAGAG
jgi:hypothetical protein